MSEVAAPPPPVVSVIIPIRDRANLFVQTAASLLAQTWHAWEGVVVDDGSAAAEFSRIAAIVAADPRLRLLRNPGPRSGACSARNAGFAASQGEYVVFLDSDDLLVPTCLERRVAAMTLNPDLDFVAYPTRLFNEAPGDNPQWWNLFTEENDLDRIVRTDLPWQTAGVIWRRRSLAKLPVLWDERARNWQDWEFNIRMLVAGLRYLKVPEPDSFWRTPTAVGAISTSAHTPLGILNRVRTFLRVAELLRQRGALTPYRRQILATSLFQEAFQRPQLRSATALLIWRLTRQSGLISMFQYVSILAAEFAWRTSRKFERRRFPDVLGRRRTFPDSSLEDM